MSDIFEPRTFWSRECHFANSSVYLDTNRELKLRSSSRPEFARCQKHHSSVSFLDCGGTIKRYLRCSDNSESNGSLLKHSGVCDIFFLSSGCFVFEVHLFSCCSFAIVFLPMASSSRLRYDPGDEIDGAGGLLTVRQFCEVSTTAIFKTRGNVREQMICPLCGMPRSQIPNVLLPSMALNTLIRHCEINHQDLPWPGVHRWLYDRLITSPVAWCSPLAL